MTLNAPSKSAVAITDSPRTLPRWLELALLVAILLVAATFRFHALDAIPPGLTHDEAAVGFYAAAVARGARATYSVPYGYAYEPYGQYSAGLLMRLLGPTDYALRAHQALYGLLVVVLTYAWARLAFGRAVALGASALAATLFWTVFTSRMALNSQPVPAVFLLAAIALWRGLYGSPEWRWGWWVAYALSVAAMLHIYEAARAVWFAFPAFAAYLLLTDRARLRRRGIGFVAALGVGTALALPHLLNPGAWGRTEALSGAVGALFAGDPAPLAANVLEGLGTLGVRGDSLVTYNNPGQPMLWPLLAAFFGVGLVVCAARIRRPAHAFLLLWLAFGLAPTLVIGAYTSTLHSIAAQPTVCVVTAVGATWLVREGARRASRLAALGLAALWAAALLLTGVMAARDYFMAWGQSPDVRAAYFHTLAEITARLDADTEGGVVGVSSPFPEPPLDPFIGLMRIHNAGVDVRWMDARLAVVLPPVDSARLVASADAPIDPALAQLLGLEHIERVRLRPDDHNPYYDVYRLHPSAVRARLQAGLPAPQGGGEAVFGGALALRRCQASLDGPALEIVTLWEVLDPDALGEPPSTQYAHELAIFVHALDGEGAIAGQSDALGAPTSDWREGDMFLHVHRPALSESLGGDGVELVVGVYHRPDLSRLPLIVDGAPAGDALPLRCSAP